MVVPPVVHGNVSEMSAIEAYQFLHDNPDAVFIDVRQEIEHYYVGYPKGSVTQSCVLQKVSTHCCFS